VKLSAVRTKRLFQTEVHNNEKERSSERARQGTQKLSCAWTTRIMGCMALQKRYLKPNTTNPGWW